MFSPAKTFNRESSSTIEKGSLRGFRDQNPKSQWEARGDPDLRTHHKYAYRSRVLIYAEAEDIVTRVLVQHGALRRTSASDWTLTPLLPDGHSQVVFILTQEQYNGHWKGHYVFFLLWMCNIINYLCVYYIYSYRNRTIWLIPVSRYFVAPSVIYLKYRLRGFYLK